jgi:hypothetical protein
MISKQESVGSSLNFPVYCIPDSLCVVKELTILSVYCIVGELKFKSLTVLTFWIAFFLLLSPLVLDLPLEQS